MATVTTPLTATHDEALARVPAPLKPALPSSMFWLPTHAVGYFFRHPQLWATVGAPLCCALVINLVIVILLLALGLWVVGW